MLKLTRPEAEIFVPDNAPVEAALKRTTVMGVGAHQDDLEILSYHGILRAFGKADEWYTGVVVTNGSGSPRADLYATYSDDQMRAVRRLEQKKAAMLGEYGAMVFLDYPSAAVKSAADPGPVADLRCLFEAARPEVVYTHNLADKHDTHVSVTLRVIQALRELPEAVRPKSLYGVEIWRDLDWLCDHDKVILDVSAHENLATSLVGVFDSQIAGGKRYDLATWGRRRANATYLASHAVDKAEALSFAMDLSPLLRNPQLSPTEIVRQHIRRFEEEVAHRLTAFAKS